MEVSNRGETVNSGRDAVDSVVFLIGPTCRYCPDPTISLIVSGDHFSGQHSRLNLKESLMAAVLLDGKQLAQTMQAEIAARVAELVQGHGVRPGLAAVIVGDNPASQIYVRNKRKACEKA